jgi:hypothetical protein
MWREKDLRQSANPVRELFDATAQGYAIKLSCPGCRRTRIFHAAAVWHHFRRKGFSERLRDVPKKFRCRICERRTPIMELVHEEPDDMSLPMPGELVWKHELRRRR